MGSPPGEPLPIECEPRMAVAVGETGKIGSGFADAKSHACTVIREPLRKRVQGVLDVVGRSKKQAAFVGVCRVNRIADPLQVLLLQQHHVTSFMHEPADDDAVPRMHVPFQRRAEITDELGVLMGANQLVDQIRLEDAPVVPRSLLDVLVQQNLGHLDDHIAKRFDTLAFTGHADDGGDASIDQHRRIDAVLRALVGMIVVHGDASTGRRRNGGRLVVLADACGIGAGDDGPVGVEQVNLVPQHALDVGHNRRGDGPVDFHDIDGNWYTYQFAGRIFLCFL